MRAPRARAYVIIQPAPVTPLAPVSSASRSAAHNRRCTPPPRGYFPGPTPRSSIRAPVAATAIRPAGLNSTSQLAAIHDQDTSGAHGAGASRVRILPSAASTVSQRSPTRASIGSISSAWISPERSGVGRTSRRVVSCAPSASTAAAICDSRGLW